MAAATEELIANETEIREAMSTLRLDNWVDDVLDEIELDRELKISEEQEKTGRTITIEELEKRVNEKVANGYYRR